MYREFEPVKVNYPYVTMRILAYEVEFIRDKTARYGIREVSSSQNSQILGDDSVPKNLYRRAVKQARGIMVDRERQAKRQEKKAKLKEQQGNLF